MEAPKQTTFLCQKCQHPLALDQLDIDAARYDLLRKPRQTSVAQPPEADETESFPEPATTITIPRPAAAAAADEPARWSSTAQELFDTLSSDGSIDHPLCQECADMFFDDINKRSERTIKDIGIYQNALAQLEARPVPNIDALRARLAELEREEALMTSNVEQLTREHDELLAQVAAANSEASALDLQEEKHWLDYNEYQRMLFDFLDFQCGVETQYDHAREQWERLKKTNVLNDAFHIWHEGHFGTINGLRLGRLPAQPVDWNEINAAWGQVALLMTVMFRLTNFTLSRYVIVPGGSCARLESLEKPPRELPLYGQGSFRLFTENKFDVAMVAFLDCLQQFTVFIETQDQHFRLPYRIDGDKIGEGQTMHTIRQSGADEAWTKALKLVLTNIKWCLAWVCRQNPQ